MKKTKPLVLFNWFKGVERRLFRLSFFVAKKIQKVVKFCFKTKLRSIISSFLIIVLLSSSFLLSFKPQTSQADYTNNTNQSDWSGGADTGATVTPGTAEGWSKYYEKDSDVVAGATISATPSLNSITQTSDTDFNAGANSQTSISGSGDSGSVVLEGPGSVNVSGEEYSTCAVQGGEKNVYCWGYNNYGQLGDGSIIQSKTPVKVLTGAQSSGTYLSNIKQVDNGNKYVCAVTYDGEVYCWGNNGTAGWLGTGNHYEVHAPARVLGGDQGGQYLENVEQIKAGQAHTCAVTYDGEVYCWGEANDGCLGVGNTTSYNIPKRVKGGDQGGTYLSDVKKNSCFSELCNLCCN